MKRDLRILCGLIALTWLMASSTWAAEKTAVQLAWEAADKVARRGPQEVPFGDQAVLALPEGVAFIPLPQSAELMKTWGNSTDASFKGLLVSTRDGENWAVSVTQVAEGFVKDEDAKTWNADELLKSLKAGTEAQNVERLKMGIPALDISGWVEPPHYDPVNHHLIWSLKANARGGAAGAEATVNYNTYALGRDGYFEINMMTGTSTIESDKAEAQSLLAAFHYNSGKRYEDFNADTDHLAEYGIAALIAGVAAQKLGILAIVGVFFLKFAKIILIAVAVAGAGFVKFFRRGGGKPTA